MTRPATHCTLAGPLLYIQTLCVTTPSAIACAHYRTPDLWPPSIVPFTSGLSHLVFEGTMSLTLGEHLQSCLNCVCSVLELKNACVHMLTGDELFAMQ